MWVSWNVKPISGSSIAISSGLAFTAPLFTAPLFKCRHFHYRWLAPSLTTYCLNPPSFCSRLQATPFHQHDVPHQSVWRHPQRHGHRDPLGEGSRRLPQRKYYALLLSLFTNTMLRMPLKSPRSRNSARCLASPTSLSMKTTRNTAANSSLPIQHAPYRLSTIQTTA